MAHAIGIEDRGTRATKDERLIALKARYIPAPDNQQQLGDGDLNKVMDPDLYEATKTKDANKFVDALEAVAESRKLALLLVFDQVTPSGDSLLHVAASSGGVDVIALILIHFPNAMTRKNSSGDTPLHVAVQSGGFDAAKTLIRPGTDLEVMYWKNKDGKSPLYLAAETGCMEILRLLLDSYARDEAYAVKIQGMSPVLAALKQGNLGILEEIIDRLPNLLRVRGEDGGTPLHSAASLGNVRAVELLLRKCRNLALQTDKNGSYPIHIACEGGNVDIIRQLVKMWPDLAEIKNKMGRNILHVAAKGGNSNAVRYILKQCDKLVTKKVVNSQDVDGNTPLHLASMHNHCEVMLYLIKDKRSDLLLRNNRESTARDVATESESPSMKYPPFLGASLLGAAGVPRGEGRDVRSPTEQSSGASESPRIERIKKAIDIVMVVATLVASVTFTAGISLPGGYDVSSDPHPGAAALLHNRVFQIFLYSNAGATYSSILSIMMLLWVRGADVGDAEVYYYMAQLALSGAVYLMMVAFLAALVLAVSELTGPAIFLLCCTVPYPMALYLGGS